MAVWVNRMLVLPLFAVLSFAGGDWPQWRGPHRDGALTSFVAPKSWPETLKRKWTLTVGEGHSSPVFASGKIFVFTRQQSDEVLTCVDPELGKVSWRVAYPAPYKVNPAADSHGAGPKSTPVVYQGRVFTLGIGGVLSSFDAATGKAGWRKNFAGEFRETSPWYGTATSPVVDGGLVIAHVGGHDDGALMAFDAATGTVKWKWKGDGPGYASPIVVELAGKRQVVTETQQNIVGVAAATGELLWKIPFTTEFTQNAVTPLPYGDMLIFSGLSNGTRAVRASAKDGKWSTETVWHNKEMSMYMNSPVIAGDRVCGFTHRNKGQVFCLDARTGSTLLTGSPRQGDNAALIAAGDLLFVLKDDGQLLVASPTGTTFAPIRSYTVAESPTWAHPLILPGGLVIKDATTLALWEFN